MKGGWRLRSGRRFRQCGLRPAVSAMEGGSVSRIRIRSWIWRIRKMTWVVAKLLQKEVAELQSCGRRLLWVRAGAAMVVLL